MEQFKATGIAALLNTIVFHTRMVDQVEEMLVDTSDLSLFCFYARLFEDHFQMCLEFPAQNRYIIAFPLICGHFAQITNEFCPEERTHIRERSLSVVNLFLDEMAKESKNIITTICDEHCNMSDRLLPKHCAALIAEVSFFDHELLSRSWAFSQIFCQNVTNEENMMPVISENFVPK